jgi:DNA-binding NarL/FixJ family response regulator
VQAVRTAIVDDHPVFRQGLRQLIAHEPRFEVVAEADDGLEGLDQVNKQKADVLILDIGLPGLNGLEVARRLQASRSSVKVIILTMHGDEEIFNKAISLDVRGYILKENAPSEIVNCLKTVAAGDYYLTPALSACLLKRRKRTEALEETKPGLSQLTTAERRILQRIAQNLTSKEIATEFCISPRTVEAHRTNMCDKLGLHGSNRLLQFAIEHRSEL